VGDVDADRFFHDRGGGGEKEEEEEEECFRKGRLKGGRVGRKYKAASCCTSEVRR
jgi:hypothetical protein